MTAPDRDAIRAALRAVPDVIFDVESGYSYKLVASEADALTPTVAALMEDYAADLRAEIERLRQDLSDAAKAIRSSGPFRNGTITTPAATADRDAYAAEKVRAALLDAAEAIEARSARMRPHPWVEAGLRSAYADAVAMLRRRAGAS